MFVTKASKNILAVTLLFFLLFSLQNNAYAQIAGGWTDTGPKIIQTNVSDKVGIGTTNPTSRLHVVGKTNLIGNVGIGTTNSNMPLLVGAGTLTGFAPHNDVFSVRQDYSANEDHLTATVVSNFTGTNALSVQGIESYITTNHTSGNVNLILPQIANVEHRAAGTINWVKLYSGAFIMNNGSGNVTNVASLLSSPVVRIGSPGNIQNYYGLYLDAQPTSGITNRYGVYQMGVGELNYFAGKIGVGTTNPAFEVDVMGTISAKKYTVGGNNGSASAGSGTISASTGSTTINTTAVKSNSLIFVTSRTNVNSPLSVTSRVANSSFTVSIGATQSQNVEFDWWIVDKQ